MKHALAKKKTVSSILIQAHGKIKAASVLINQKGDRAYVAHFDTQGTVLEVLPLPLLAEGGPYAQTATWEDAIAIEGQPHLIAARHQEGAIRFSLADGVAYTARFFEDQWGGFSAFVGVGWLDVDGREHPLRLIELVEKGDPICRTPYPGEIKFVRPRRGAALEIGAIGEGRSRLIVFRSLTTRPDAAAWVKVEGTMILLVGHVDEELRYLIRDEGNKGMNEIVPGGISSESLHSLRQHLEIS